MNNKFNISDTIIIDNKKYEIKDTTFYLKEDGYRSVATKVNGKLLFLELIEPNTIEEEDKKNHILTYEFSFDTPLVDNMVGNIYAISKDILCKNFIDSLNAHMIHSLGMGTFEIPDIKWEYMNVEEMTIEEDNTIESKCCRCGKNVTVKIGVEPYCKECLDIILSTPIRKGTDNDGSLSNIMNETHFDPIGKQAPVGLDYEKEYNKLLEEHEQTKELLEIAKVALKLTTELISTNE
jgi:hypothetical protein